MITGNAAIKIININCILLLCQTLFIKSKYCFFRNKNMSNNTTTYKITVIKKPISLVVVSMQPVIKNKIRLKLFTSSIIKTININPASIAIITSTYDDLKKVLKKSVEELSKIELKIRKHKQKS